MPQERGRRRGAIPRHKEISIVEGIRALAESIKSPGNQTSTMPTTYKSHMPKGATQSPKGDLAARRVAEADSQRNIMHRGGFESGSKYFAGTVSAPGSMGEK